MTARLAGYYSRKVHHTGLHSREAVWMVDGHSDIGIAIRRNRAQRLLIDTAQSGQLSQHLAAQPVIDQSEIGTGALPGIVAASILPAAIGGQCTE